MPSRSFAPSAYMFTTGTVLGSRVGERPKCFVCLVGGFLFYVSHSIRGGFRKGGMMVSTSFVLLTSRSIRHSTMHLYLVYRIAQSVRLHDSPESRASPIHSTGDGVDAKKPYLYKTFGSVCTPPTPPSPPTAPHTNSLLSHPRLPTWHPGACEMDG